LLPRNLLSYALDGDRVVPGYLADRDEVWIRPLVDELDALVGRSHGDADGVLREKLPRLASEHGVALRTILAVRHILEKIWQSEIKAAAPPPEIRRVVFELASDGAIPRAEILSRAAAILGIRAEEVKEGLFADRLTERRLVAPRAEPSIREIVERYNLALVQGLLLRSEQVVARVVAGEQSVVRFAKLASLPAWYAVDGGAIEISLEGPVALARHTLKYGLALAKFFPTIAVTPGWSLEARCEVEGRIAMLRVGACDPIVATHALPSHGEPLVEKRLAAEFRRLASRWAIRREITALPVGRWTFFPDFTLDAGGARAFVELVGFHTRGYVEAKLRALRDAGVSNVILCIDETLACSGEPSAAGDVIPYRKGIDAEILHRAVERCLAGPADDTSEERS
jgi:predicted nuclease of restriction endonuclease-like RecB superfamily